jgi:MYXO-CTERM domain-containing protein
MLRGGVSKLNAMVKRNHRSLLLFELGSDRAGPTKGSHMFHFCRKQLLIASAAILVPGTAVAQDTVTDQANRVAEQAQELQQETNELTNAVAERAADNAAAAAPADADRNDRDDDDDSGKLGLLGLLGLAGLLGLKRRDDHRHRHPDDDRGRGSRL